jgi:hypothetical protein
LVRRRGKAILTRSSLLSIFLAVAVTFAGWNLYATWQSGPWDLPASKTKPSPLAVAETAELAPRPPVNTDMIVARNLFDPERGAGATRDAEESSRSAQRVRNMILVGTVIIGGNRTAVLQDGASSNTGPSAPVQQPTPMRLKLGDNIEGYRLSEIADKKVVFTKDTAKIELLLDYFRKIEVAQPRPAPPGQVVPPGVAAPAPRVIPNLPRRGRVPVPGAPAPSS